MSENGPRLVVGAIIVDDLDCPTSVLAARRTGPAELAGLWEFPGGKVEDGETPEQALVREIHEELAATVTVGDEFPHPDGAWPISDKYQIRLYFAVVGADSPSAAESHDELRWLSVKKLQSVTWLPSDAQAIVALQQRWS
jgi:8-oxo-dGTP diphosphatase